LLYNGGVYTTLDDPGAFDTYAFGINKNGHVVGVRLDKFGDRGFFERPVPNPPPPGGTTADMILRGANGSPSASQYEIYDIGNNSILAGYSIATIGTDWQFAGLGRFFGSDTTDMILRNGNTGAFELYDIVNNTITSAANLGTVGLDWQVAGVAPVSGAGRSDCVLRNANTGAFEVYDIANNTITSAVSLGAVGLDWQLGGFAVDPPTASAGDSSQVGQLVQAMAGFGGGSGAGDDLAIAALAAGTSPQDVLAMASIDDDSRGP
jgi:hypothetical protein